MRAFVNRNEDRRIDEDGTSDIREPRNLMRGLQEELRRTNIELLEIGNLELLTDDKACGRNGSDLSGRSTLSYP
jgi:hypothetical protein